MKYFIIVGEDSGDLHGSRLVRELLDRDPQAVIRGMGGERMEAAGMELWKHFRELAVMGVSDVLRNLGRIRHSLRECSAEIRRFAPDRLILIDYGGFNLRIAKLAKAEGMRVDYYILPKVWAWNEGRVQKIRAFVDHAYVIFPFEEAYFRKHGVEANYVGNPVKEQIDKYLTSNNIERKSGQIALLPGSRKGEISRILPAMLSAADMLKEYSFTLALNGNASNLVEDIKLPTNVELVYDRTYNVLAQSEFALVTSGTANLETALLGTPQIVCYRTTALNYRLGRWFIKVPYLSPVNLILNRGAVPERIQGACNGLQLVEDIRNLQSGQAEVQKAAIEELNVILGDRIASARVAEQVIQTK